MNFSSIINVTFLRNMDIFHAISRNGKQMPNAQIFNTVDILRYGNVLNSHLAEATQSPSNSIYPCTSISRCLSPRVEFGRGTLRWRVDTGRFKVCRGSKRRRGMTKRTVGCSSPMTNSVCFPRVALGDCWNSRKQGGWASQRFYNRPRDPTLLLWVMSQTIYAFPSDEGARSAEYFCLQLYHVVSRCRLDVSIQLGVLITYCRNVIYICV